MMGEDLRERILLTLFGALAGLGAGLAVMWWANGVTRLELVAPILVMAFFFDFLMLARRGRYLRAALSSAAIAVPLSLLFLWASLRYDAPLDYVETGYPVVIAIGLALLPVPFLVASGQPGGDWRHYPTLFAVSWALALRALAAVLFVGIFWAVVLVSDELLQLVGIVTLRDLLDSALVDWLLSGAAFGLGLSVLGEIDVLGVPKLVLRLLRLFVPLALGIGAIFLLALPFRGLTELFGAGSPAAILTSIAIGAIGLISVALGEDGSDAVESRPMQAMTRALALMLPLIAALAAWAVWLRMRDYGWTPDRFMAALGAGVILVYAGAYGLSAIRPGDWMGRIRAANAGVALGVIGLGALTFTPLLDAGAISARSQAARYLGRTAEPADLPIWEMQNEWGRAGPVALKRMLAAEDHPQATALRADVEWAERSDSRWAGRPGGLIADQNAVFSDFLAAAPVYPAGTDLPGWFDADLADYRSRGWRDACGEKIADGLPGCALFVADFETVTSEPEVMVIYAVERGIVLTELFASAATGRVSRHAFPIRQKFEGLSNSALFNSLASGEFGFAPMSLRALRIGSETLEPGIY